MVGHTGGATDEEVAQVYRDLVLGDIPCETHRKKGANEDDILSMLEKQNESRNDMDSKEIPGHGRGLMAMGRDKKRQLALRERVCATRERQRYCMRCEESTRDGAVFLSTIGDGMDQTTTDFPYMPVSASLTAFEENLG